MKKYQYFYFTLLYMLYALYALLFAGFGMYDLEKYIENLNIALRLSLSVILLVRFNPFQDYELDRKDQQLVFSCALFLLTSLGIDQFYQFSRENNSP